MKPASTAAQNLIKNSATVKAVPKVFAEWEHNRFSPITSIAVTPAQTTDVDWSMTYDLDSIGLPNRPGSGIAKARFDANGSLKTSTGYRDTPSASRFYLSTEDDVYKYFSTTQKTGASAGSDGGYAFSQPIVLTLLYQNLVATNKIVVGFETSFSAPKSFQIDVTTNGTTWSPIANNSALDANGRVTLWRGDFGQWSAVPDYDSPTTIKGIRLTVTSLTKPNQHLDVIQMGARLENDLSDFVEGYSRNFEVSDRSLIAPLGLASSNTANVSLNNIDRRFNNENSSSLYYGLIGKKVKLTCELSLDVSSSGGSADERIREFTMYSDSWGGQEEASVTVELKDSSVFLQDIPAPKVFWEGLTVGAIIWQLMDILGFSNYSYTRSVLDTGQTMPYFWTQTDKTAWEMISELAEGTQTAVFFDEYDVMQIRTRRALYGDTKAVAWNLDAVTNGTKLADVEAIGKDDTFVVNKVDVTYKPVKYVFNDNGTAQMETVWEPEDDYVTLRSSPLTKDLLATATEMWIPPADTLYWPFEASVTIRGETLSYKGKEYVYKKPGGATAYGWVYSLEDKQKFDAASDPNLAYANAYSGKLKIVQRAMNGTIADNHYTRSASYTGLVTDHSNTKLYPIGNTQGFNIANGVNTLTTPFNAGDHDLTLWKHEAVVSSTNALYGMRFMFPSKQVRADGGAIGGLFFAGDNLDAGYYLEISPTPMIDLEKRQLRNEISLIRMGANVSGVLVTKGAAVQIVPDVWYDLDVTHKVGGQLSNIGVYLNGVEVSSNWSVLAANRPVSQNRFGMFLRANAKMAVEYLYAISQDTTETPDQSTFLDLRRGGYGSGYIERQWKYGTPYTTTSRGPVKQGSKLFTGTLNKANYALDEFGPVVHEVRDFEVSFNPDTVPVRVAYPYFSNDSQVVCTNFWADPFGAKFTLANASRHNAVLKGEDTITFGTDEPIQQQFFVYGQVMTTQDQKTHTEEDKQSVRRNGVISLTFDNPYIQDDSAATELGAWVVQQWGAGSDEIKATVFGNPFLQLGDLVTMNYPIKDMTPATHKYYIVSISNTFDNGLETEVLLRRANIS